MLWLLLLLLCLFLLQLLFLRPKACAKVYRNIVVARAALVAAAVVE